MEYGSLYTEDRSSPLGFSGIRLQMVLSVSWLGNCWPHLPLDFLALPPLRRSCAGSPVLGQLACARH